MAAECERFIICEELYVTLSDVPQHSVAFLSNKYILQSNQLEPFLQSVTLNSQYQQVAERRFVVPGIVSALATSPDSTYCVAGIDEKIYIWDLITGGLLSILSQHSQKVNVIKFTDNGSHFVTGGEDSMVLVWKLVQLVSHLVDSEDQFVPRYSFTDHTLPVKDLVIGTLRRLFTASLDQKFNVYDLLSGTLLISVTCGFQLSSIAVDLWETYAYLGTTDGKILQVKLYEMLSSSRNSYSLSDSQKSNVFTGHQKVINCLSLSLNGVSLLSGSDDQKVIIWNIPSKQPRGEWEMEGPVTNAYFMAVECERFIICEKLYVTLSDVPQHSVAFLSNKYILQSNQLEPFLQSVTLNSQYQRVAERRFVVPGIVSALATSPDSTYCVAGIDEKIYIWDIITGGLLSILSQHSQKVNVIKFTDNGSHFVTGGEDSMVLVWKLVQLVSHLVDSEDQFVPRYSFTDHTLPVKDLVIGTLRRLFTASLDQKFNVYDLLSGTLLISVTCGFQLSSIAVDLGETYAYLGTTDGKILQVKLYEMLSSSRNSYSLSDSQKSNVFTGHQKVINCLSLSLNGVSLLSGSDDQKVIIWNIPSKQPCGEWEMEGPVTNAYFNLISKKKVFQNVLH